MLIPLHEYVSVLIALSLVLVCGNVSASATGGANTQARAGLTYRRVGKTNASTASYANTVRFLEQSTFGPTPELIAHVQRIGFDAFLEEQFVAPMSGYADLPLMKQTPPNKCKLDSPSTCYRDNYTMYPLQRQFFYNALYGDDQLRQRVAFALSQIFVVSGRDITLSSWMVYYLKTLDRNALGNYRQLLYEITLNPAMGNYLDMVGNSKTSPNENYARELLQLFSIGVDELNLDGTPKLNERGEHIPAYDQNTISNFARVFTGWNFDRNPAVNILNYKDSLRFSAYNHDTDAKTLLNGLALPANQSGEQDLNAAIDNIFNHNNVAPFICKQLIQHLVTSNPSPAYVARIAQVFNDNRTSPNQMRAVVKAILLDSAARGDTKNAYPNYGHLREPAQFITNILRAFNAKSADGSDKSDGHLNPYSALMGQDVFKAPSVFNFYRPDTRAPGTNILGPQFGINTTATAIQRLNFVDKIVFNGIATSVDAPLGTSLDLSPMQSLAQDSAKLVEALNKLLLHGTMPAEMRGIVTNAVERIPASDSLLRARTAVYLVASSPQYQIQR